jgi:hypothetical protein
MSREMYLRAEAEDRFFRGLKDTIEFYLTDVRGEVRLKPFDEEKKEIFLENIMISSV